MTQGGVLDVISKNAGELVRRENARDLAANVVQAIFRLVKLSTLHSIDNQAVVRQVEEAVELINDYGLRAGLNVSILFAHGSIFVGGQLLKANRSIYEGATELGEVLEKCGASELAIAKDARAADLYSFCSAVADALRSATPQKVERPSPRVRLRAVSEAALRRGMAIEKLTPEAAIVRTYASAVVIMRRFLEDLQKGRFYLPQRVKRIAQSLVDLAAGETPAFLGVTAVRNANHDDAGRAVNSAILAVAIARQITTDQVTLVRLAMAALLFDTGRPRLVGIRPGGRAGVIPQLSDQQEAEVPAGTAVVLTALGRVNEPSVMRTVIGYEAHWVRRQARLGPLYRGLRQATIQARIIAIARTFNDLLTPAPGATPMSADEAIGKLEHDMPEAADRTVLRLLFGALGVFPTGTLVELSTGEVALVVQTPSHPSKYSQPRVRLVFDASGGAIQQHHEIDLAQRPPKGEPRRHIKRVVATSDEAGGSMRQHAQGPTVGSGVRSQDSGPSWDVSPPPAGRTPQPQPPAAPPPPASRARSAAPLPPTHPPPYQSATARPGPAAPVPPSPVQAEIEAPDTTDDGAEATRAMAWKDQAYLLPPDVAAAAAPQPAPAEPRPTVRPEPAAATGPEPTAEGNLTRTPLVHLLVYMLDQRLSGTTVFHAPDGMAHGVYFVEGTPAKIRTGAVVAPLDRVILELGLLDEATLRGTLMEVSKRKILHGRHLVGKGLLDRETVIAALRLQVMRKLQYLFELPPATRYAYYDGVNMLASYGGPELTPGEPLAAIMAGVRLRADDPLVDATLERISGRAMALHLDAEMRRFELTRDEAAICDLLRARRMTLADLLNAGVAPERVVKLMIYALAITRHLDIGVPGRPPVGVVHRDRTGVSSVTEPGPVAIRDAGGAAPPPPARARTPASPTAGAAIVDRPPASSGPSSGHTPPPQSTGLRLGGGPPRASEPDAPPPSQRSPIAQPGSSENTSAPARAGDTGARRTGFGMSFGQPPTRGPEPGVNPPPQPAAPPAAATPPVSSPPPSGRGAETPSGARHSDVSTGQRVWADAGARRIEIEKRLKTVDGEDYFQLLGLGHDATHEQVQKAYFAVAKTWHPDRLPPELEDLKASVSRAFSRFNEAYQTLNDPQKRQDYTRLVKEGGGTPDDQEQVARVVNAALEFQKAEVLLKKHDLAGAEALATRAVQADPEQPEYLTLLVWIQAQRRPEPPAAPEGKSNPHYDDLIKILDKVITKEPRYERALFYRGMLLKRAGRSEASIKDFRLAAEINPKNLDAVREVRVHDMRRRGHPADPAPNSSSGGGLLGKFFKK